MRQILNLRPFCAAPLLAAAVILFSNAAFAQSGEVTLGNTTIEPAFDDVTGQMVFYLEPKNAPFPVNANAHAIAPLYAVVYPVQSTIPADSLNCQSTNCDHLNVLPFPAPGYDPDFGAASDDYASGSNAVCTAFNGGSGCSPVKGHDHLLGIAQTGGDFNVAWHAVLVLFTPKAFADGTINTPITTLAQLQALEASGEVFPVETPIMFDCAIVSQQTYERGTPMEISLP